MTGRARKLRSNFSVENYLCKLSIGTVFGQYSMKQRQLPLPRGRVVLSDVLGGKDVVEGRDGRTDGWTRRIVIGRIRVKTKLHAQIRFYVLPLVNIVG
jgi:hypothetical protein